MRNSMHWFVLVAVLVRTSAAQPVAVTIHAPVRVSPSQS